MKRLSITLAFLLASCATDLTALFIAVRDGGEMPKAGTPNFTPAIAPGNPPANSPTPLPAPTKAATPRAFTFAGNVGATLFLNPSAGLIWLRGCDKLDQRISDLYNKSQDAVIEFDAHVTAPEYRPYKLTSTVTPSECMAAVWLIWDDRDEDGVRRKFESTSAYWYTQVILGGAATTYKATHAQPNYRASQADPGKADFEF